MTAALAESYACCRRVAVAATSNFCSWFYLLPRDQRRSMYALYAFLRKTDDLCDGDGPVADRQTQLDRWRAELQAALDGQAHDPILPALADTVRRYAIPPVHLHEVIDGCVMDLQGQQYETFDELSEYCQRVASAVGLACLRVWGYRDDAALGPARQCGIAFQLTNILRDLREDAQRGRIYLPREDLQRFEYTPEELTQGIVNDRFRRLMRFQIRRNTAYYRQASGLLPYLNGPGRRIYGAMVDTYQTLLDEIERREGDVFSHRVRVSNWKKLSIAARWSMAGRFQRNRSES